MTVANFMPYKGYGVLNWTLYLPDSEDWTPDKLVWAAVGTRRSVAIWGEFILMSLSLTQFSCDLNENDGQVSSKTIKRFPLECPVVHGITFFTL